MGEDKDRATTEGLKMAEKIRSKTIETPTQPRKRAGCRPKYETPEEMQSAIDAYFKACDKAEKTYTSYGLARALGFTSRQAVMNYENGTRGGGAFVDVIKKAKVKMLESVEERLLTKGQNAVACMFWLKNAGVVENWRDTQQLEHTGENGGPINITVQQFGAKKAEKPVPA